MKVKCPNCDSKKILYWQELVFTVYKKVKRDGSVSEKIHHKTPAVELDTCGYVCQECKKMGYFGNSSMDEFIEEE